MVVFRRAERISDSLSTDPIKSPTILRFDSAIGRLLDEWGAGEFAMPPGLRVDAPGNRWLTDLNCGGDRTRRARFPSAPMKTGMGLPSKAVNLKLAATIALDRAEHVYVADRTNARIQVFDSLGHFLAKWNDQVLGRPWEVRVGVDGYVYVVDGGDLPTSPPDRARVLKLTQTGRVVESFGAFGNYYGLFVWPCRRRR